MQPNRQVLLLRWFSTSNRSLAAQRNFTSCLQWLPPTTAVTIQSHLLDFHILTICLGDFVGFQVTPWLPHQLRIMFIICCQRSVSEYWDFGLKTSSYIYSPTEKVKSNGQAPFTISRKSPSSLEALLRKKLKGSQLRSRTQTAFRLC